MKAAFLMPLLLLAGCDQQMNRFEVAAPGAASAVVSLCGETIQLAQKGEAFSGARPTRCEGHGVITVTFPNSPPVNCPIGYVDTGQGQTFRFKVRDGRCVADVN